MQIKLSSVSWYMMWSYSHGACLLTCYTLRDTHTNAFVSQHISKGGKKKREGKWMDKGGQRWTRDRGRERERVSKGGTPGLKGGEEAGSGEKVKRERRRSVESRRAFSHSGILCAPPSHDPIWDSATRVLGEYHTVHRSSQEGAHTYKSHSIHAQSCTRMLQKLISVLVWQP